MCATILGHAALLQNPQERGEKRGQEGKEGRSEDGREKEFKCQEDEDTEKKRRKQTHTQNQTFIMLKNRFYYFPKTLK